MVKPADLAIRADFRLGPLFVSPARRLVEGPVGEIHVEPLIMQVFLLLLDAGGKVVTRDELFDHCWGGDIVGDDSLNRAIAKVRRIGEQVAPGLFEIETIPRTGYRLTGDILASGPQTPDGIDEHSLSRRVMIGSATAAGIVAAGGIGLWSYRRSEADRRFNGLMDRAEEAVRYDDPLRDAVTYLRPAVAMRPDDAKAQGLLAYVLCSTARSSDTRKPDAEVLAAERAARAALALDPKEPNARLALIALQQSMLDLAANEDRLREILTTAPDNILAMRDLWALLQSAGRSRDAFVLIERANALEPLAAANNYPRAQLLWILGRNAEADRVIDRAMQFWPSHRWVRWARFSLYAYTGRPRAALAMLDDENSRPQSFTPTAMAAWRASLAALDQRTPASISAARNANLEAAKKDPSLAISAVCVLSMLGDVDTAFDIANEFLQFRGSPEIRSRTGSRRLQIKGTGWRFTPGLFTPPTANLRADPRFNVLCDGIGLTDYWAKRGVKPDYQLGIT